MSLHPGTPKLTLRRAERNHTSLSKDSDFSANSRESFDKLRMSGAEKK